MTLSVSVLAVFCLGLAGVLLGAELILHGASRLAALFGMRPIVIGLAVVSLGTSAPELSIALTGALEGRSDLVLGNIIGTNIFNLSLILGASALIRPLPLHSLSLRFDLPVMLASGLLLGALSWDGALTGLDGLVLLGGAIAYTVIRVDLGRRESRALRRAYIAQFGEAATQIPPRGVSDHAFKEKMKQTSLLLVGLALMTVSANWLLESSVTLSRALGITETIIGLSALAIGTSIPELATTVMATLRDERDVAIGNLIGSSLYNVLAILAVSALAADPALIMAPDLMRRDLPVMLIISLVCALAFFGRHTLSRLEGAMLVLSAIAYLSVLALFADP
jgi:cation:H+ antiporter